MCPEPCTLDPDCTHTFTLFTSSSCALNTAPWTLIVPTLSPYSPHPLCALTCRAAGPVSPEAARGERGAGLQQHHPVCLHPADHPRMHTQPAPQGEVRGQHHTLRPVQQGTTPQNASRALVTVLPAVLS